MTIRTHLASLACLLSLLIHADLTCLPNPQEHPHLHPGDTITWQFTAKQSDLQQVILHFTGPQGEPIFLNGKHSVTMDRDVTKATFQASMVMKHIFTRQAFCTLQKGELTVVPELIFPDKRQKLPAASNPWTISGSPLSIAGNVSLQDGRFGDGLLLSGKQAMARLVLPFTPEQGTIEGWVHLPLIHSDNMGIVLFLQPLRSSSWTFQTLQLPGRSRTLQYVTYQSAEKPYVKCITAKPHYEDSWLYFVMTFDHTTKTMKLFLNGKLQGESDYHHAIGGNHACLSLGGRIHNDGPQNYQIISSANILVDDLRISSCLRDGTRIPNQPLEADSQTLGLFNFDGNNPFDNHATPSK